MPALTRRGKRQLPRDLEEDEDGPEGEMPVGILAQRARRREAAQQREQEEEQTGDQVCGLMFSGSIVDDMFLIFQDPTEDDIDSEDGVGQPPTPPQSSPQLQGGDRSHSSSTTHNNAIAITISQGTHASSFNCPGECGTQDSATSVTGNTDAKHE